MTGTDGQHGTPHRPHPLRTCGPSGQKTTGEPVEPKAVPYLGVLQ